MPTPQAAGEGEMSPSRGAAQEQSPHRFANAGYFPRITVFAELMLS